MVGLTTHVLDTSIGKPAYKILIELYSIKNEKKNKISEYWTDKDGRVNHLMSEEIFQKGEYELIFHVKDYFLQNNLVNSDYNFYDKITVKFTMSKMSHYHVPLLVSPFGYSTYRGS